MNQPNKERFKTSVGGQALMEGKSSVNNIPPEEPVIILLPLNEMAL